MFSLIGVFIYDKLIFIENKIIESHDPALMAMYKMIAAKFERLSNLAHLIMVKYSTVGFALPPLIVTVINYFIHDLGDESYFLTFRTLYVLKMSQKTIKTSTH